MKNNAHILVVEDDYDDSEMARIAINKFLKIQYDNVLQAMTLAQAEALFTEHKTDIVAICLDGCVDSNHLDSLPLIHFFRSEGFQGPIVTTSSLDEYRKIMLEVGCTHECDNKRSVGSVLADIFKNQQ